jgi:hypothetical protein
LVEGAEREHHAMALLAGWMIRRGICNGGHRSCDGVSVARPAACPSPLLLLTPGHLPFCPSAVFDTALLVEGHLYQLDRHLQRFLTSAAKANIPLPPGLSLEQMRRTIAETTAASCKMDGAWLGARQGPGLGSVGGAASTMCGSGQQWEGGCSRCCRSWCSPPAHTHPPTAPALPCPAPPPHAGHVRYWLTAGRGGFGLSGNECLGSAFYCVVYTKEQEDAKEDGARRCAAPACCACCAMLAGLPCLLVLRPAWCSAMSAAKPPISQQPACLPLPAQRPCTTLPPSIPSPPALSLSLSLSGAAALQSTCAAGG